MIAVLWKLVEWVVEGAETILWFFAAKIIPAVFNYGRELFRWSGTVLLVIAVWFWEKSGALLVDLLCWLIDLGTAFVVTFDFDFSPYETHLQITGQALYVMQVYIPFIELTTIVAAYYLAVGYIWVIRHIIKLIPTIG